MTDIVEVQNYSLLNMDSEMLGEIISENIGDQGISRFDLDSMGVPTGGQTSWSVPTLEGEEAKKEVTGIVVYWKDVRAFWHEQYSGGNTPPDCYSDDAKVGVGDPGGKCSECPFAEWGSADTGEGQKCKQMRILFMIRQDDILPVTVTAPPTSVGNIKKYFMRLASKGIPYYGAVTGLQLEKKKNATGIEYSEIKPVFKQKVEPKLLGEIKKIKQVLEPKLEQVRVEDQQDIAENPYETESEEIEE